jgi:hypothetical protein
MSSKIYFDESGNTGQDMLNKEQRVFVLASVDYSEKQQTDIKKIFDAKEEIHFKNLKNSGAGRRKILNFLESDFISENNIIVYYVNKEFNVCGQIVNLLIETEMYNKGYDLYAYGRHIAYMNWLFYFGNFYWNKQLFHKLLHAFVAMIRIKDTFSIDEFYKLAKELKEQVKEKHILEPIVESKKHIDEILNGVDQYSIDVTFSTFLVLCDKWYRKLENKIDIKFDQSKQIAHYKKFIEKSKELAAATDEKIEIGYDSRKIIFPSQINSLSLVNSKEEFGVQCADLLASSIAFAYNNEEGKFLKFSKQIKQSRLFKLSNAQSIWPTDDVSPEALGMAEGKGINPLDFYATYFSQAFGD